MSDVQVQRASEEKAVPAFWFDEATKLSEQIRQKAFELFERYGRMDGHDVEHWLEAEKQLLSVPRSELLENKNEFEVHIAVPGFEATEIEVTALPDSLLVKAAAVHERENKEGEVRYSEFSDQSLFRRIALPQPIDVAHVTAKLEKGVLNIVAGKAGAEKRAKKPNEKEIRVTVAAA